MVGLGGGGFIRFQVGVTGGIYNLLWNKMFGRVQTKKKVKIIYYILKHKTMYNP